MKLTVYSLFKRLLKERIPAVEVWDEVPECTAIALNLCGRLERDGETVSIDYLVDVKEDEVRIEKWINDSNEKWETVKRGLRTESAVVKYLLELMKETI